MPRDTPIVDLHRLADIPTVEKRLHQLTERYIVSAQCNGNEIVQDLITDYKELSDIYEIPNKTILCHVKALLT